MIAEFVGRAQELRTCMELLRSDELHGAVRDVVGVHGIGKSMFLDRLVSEVRSDRNVRVFQMDMEEHGLGEGYSGDFGQNASSAVLWETFARSRGMLGFLAGSDLPEFDDFRKLNRYGGLLADRQMAYNTVQLGNRSDVGTMEVTSVVTETNEGVKNGIRKLQTQLDEAFVAAWQKFTRRHTVLITIDTFELVADDELGQWIVRLARRLPKTVVILARTPTADATWIEAAKIDQLSLPYFTWAEAAEYLQQRLYGQPVRPDIVDIAHRFTDGHPGGMSLTADLIIERGGNSLDPLALRRTLDRLPTQVGQRWAELVRLILDAAQESRLRQAVEAAAVAGTFDVTLLEELLSSGDAAELPVGEVVAQLQGLRLLQQVVEVSGETYNRFRLHEFIRLSVAARIPTYDLSRWHELHRSASDHYFRSLEDIEEAQDGSYESWYQFENASWQEKKRQWLHHSGMLVACRSITRARFALVFLKAFWWWGCYVPFTLNRRLLEDWGRAASVWTNASHADPVDIESEGKKDGEFLEALTYLLNNYPMGYLKPRDASWDEIRNKLLLIRRLCAMDQKVGLRLSEAEQGDIDEAKAFVTLFLAHSRRFRDPCDPQGERYYRAATEAFERIGDHWNVAWMLYERSDMALDTGDLQTSTSLIIESATRAKQHARDAGEDWDQELLSHLHRTQADIHWARGEIGLAAAAYGRAAQQAYWFHGRPKNGPDEYTQQLYSEMTTRAAQRYAELIACGADGTEFVHSLRTTGEGVVREVNVLESANFRVDSIRQALFVRGPSDDELQLEDSPFMADWRIRYEECLDPLAGIDMLSTPITQSMGT